MEGEDNTIETPEAFLADLGNSLSAKEGVDVGLTDILKTHLLKTDPAEGAVARAWAAMSANPSPAFPFTSLRCSET